MKIDSIDITPKGKKFLDSLSLEHLRCESNCADPRVEYLFHDKNKSVYKVCRSCHCRARAVKKDEYWEYVNHASTFAAYQQERSDFVTTAFQALNDEQQRIIQEKIALSEEFYKSKAWNRLRYAALEKHYLEWGHRCLCCKRKYVALHVDHIKPRSKYPELALDINNLQVLCAECNKGKGNWSETDFRGPGPGDAA